MTLTVTDVAYAYGGASVIEEVSVSVRPGEVLAIIGPSGAGKTTLLRLLGLFDPPATGTVTFDGTDVWGTDEATRLACRRRLGMVFQEARLFDASVRRNVEYGLKVRQSWGRRLRRELQTSIGRNAENGRVQSALEVVDLAGECERDAATLSGGEAQRVAFARALAYEPDVLLLDEPTSELDPRNTSAIEEAIRAAVARDIGVAIATHDMHQAERVADRVGVLLDGELIEVGTTERVFSTPRDDRTGRFIAGELVFA